MVFTLGYIHPIYGELTAMACIEGEPYRFFTDKEGSIAMIPLTTLKEMKEEE